MIYEMGNNYAEIILSKAAYFVDEKRREDSTDVPIGYIGKKDPTPPQH